MGFWWILMNFDPPWCQYPFHPTSQSPSCFIETTGAIWSDMMVNCQHMMDRYKPAGNMGCVANIMPIWCLQMVYDGLKIKMEASVTSIYLLIIGCFCLFKGVVYHSCSQYKPWGKDTNVATCPRGCGSKRWYCLFSHQHVQVPAMFIRPVIWYERLLLIPHPPLYGCFMRLLTLMSVLLERNTLFDPSSFVPSQNVAPTLWKGENSHRMMQ